MRVSSFSPPAVSIRFPRSRPCGCARCEVRGQHGPAFGIDGSQPPPTGVTSAGISEAFSTAAPISLYGATKLASETLALEYAHRFQTPLFINRCGVMAGAGQFGRADQGIFSWWIHAWAARRPLAFIGFGGRGLQVRDCLHPDDLADLIITQMQSACGTAASMCNVSGGLQSSLSLAQLSEWCAERFGPHAVAASGETRPYDLPWIVLDHTLATERHGWRPRRPVATILEEIAQHAESHTGWLDHCGG
jgi:CDP-paratose 2-epimerase